MASKLVQMNRELASSNMRSRLYRKTLPSPRTALASHKLHYSISLTEQLTLSAVNFTKQVVHGLAFPDAATGIVFMFPTPFCYSRCKKVSCYMPEPNFEIRSGP